MLISAALALGSPEGRATHQHQSFCIQQLMSHFAPCNVSSNTRGERHVHGWVESLETDQKR